MSAKSNIPDNTSHHPTETDGHVHSHRKLEGYTLQAMIRNSYKPPHRVQNRNLYIDQTLTVKPGAGSRHRFGEHPTSTISDTQDYFDRTKVQPPCTLPR
jgi:ribonuclease I